MCVNWKRAAALGLAVLIGGMTPMSTMFAAEKEAEIGVDSISENDQQPEDADPTALAMESDAGAKEAEPQTVTEGETAADEESLPDDGAAEIVSADLSQENAVVEAAKPDADLDTQDDDDDDDDENVGDPQITVRRDGNDCTRSLGGKIDYEYVKHWGPQVTVSVGSDRKVSVFWCLDSVTDTEIEAKTEEQMDSLNWIQRQTPSETVLLSQDGKYVIYFKVETGGQKYYARSRGIVVDTAAPKIKEAVSGEPFVPGQTYPSDTKFLVEDANLDIVRINEQETAPLADGKYQVAAQENSTSCVIRAIDKAGNESSCSITVSGEGTQEPEPEPKPEPPEENKVISQSGEYDLKAGVKYRLAAGTWKVDGDGSVYPGDSDFYVKADGTYSFSK